MKRIVYSKAFLYLQSWTLKSKKKLLYWMLAFVVSIVMQFKELGSFFMVLTLMLCFHAIFSMNSTFVSNRFKDKSLLKKNTLNLKLLIVNKKLIKCFSCQDNQLLKLSQWSWITFNRIKLFIYGLYNWWRKLSVSLLTKKWVGQWNLVY